MKIGDIVVTQIPGSVMSVHRVIRIDSNSKHITVKGDANPGVTASEKKIEASDIVGRVEKRLFY